jgi:hypothetical protein
VGKGEPLVVPENSIRFMDTHDVSLSWDQRRFERTGEVTAGRTPIHNHRPGFFVHSMVNFIQILFATERMLDSIEGPAQSGRALI